MLKIKSLLLMLPLCGATLSVNSPVALAQNGVTDENGATLVYPAPAQTPEAAGAMFYQFLSVGAPLPGLGILFGSEQTRPYLNSISRAQLENISANEFKGGQDEGALKLFVLLAQQKDEPQFEGKVVGKEGEQTLVEVSPAPVKKRAVVVVPEDGGYRVDLKATYGRWNDLSGEALDVAWYKFTGIESSNLANNATFQRERENTRRTSCQVNLKQAMLGILQYSQDYDEHYPTANKWIDNVMPYVKSEQMFRCPSLPEGSNYGYALNQNLSGLSMARMNDVAQLVAIYETDDLTRNAYGVADERAYRHFDGSNIAFADGHVKWFEQGKEPKNQVSFKP